MLLPPGRGRERSAQKWTVSLYASGLRIGTFDKGRVSVVFGIENDFHLWDIAVAAAK
jgi:hypothetical protein